MRVQVRLFANLRARLPAAAQGRSEVEIAAGASLADLIEQLGIPDPLAQMVLVDGLQQPRNRERRAERILEEGETVSIFPPIAGG
ncbi:MAG TPA: MoaD/ThiS family protein [Myxococcota bacterium]|nr:MoaD/ThiS family protein [Myxococcota bacterium]